MTNVYIKVDWSQTPKIRFLHESQFHMVCVLLCCFKDGRGIGECKLSNGFLTRFGPFDFFLG